MCNDLIENVHFRIPQENWHKYPAWLLLCMHEIIGPVIGLFAIAMKILMKKEMKQFFFGNSVHPIQCGPHGGPSMRFHGDNNPQIIITPSEY